jgi:hypothetical protein
MRAGSLRSRDVVFQGKFARGGYWSIRCNCCHGQNVPYTLVDHVWKKVTKPGDRFLCLKCVSGRLGRKLTVKDFELMNDYGIALPINNGCLGFDVRRYCLHNRTVSPRKSIRRIQWDGPCKSLFRGRARTLEESIRILNLYAAADLIFPPIIPKKFVHRVPVE